MSRESSRPPRSCGATRSRSSGPPHVAILMATYNGSPHMREQLSSILAQSHKNWSLWIGDDGSTDETYDILDEFIRLHPGADVTFVHQAGLGTTRNFLDLLRRADLPDGFFAFCDQDDKWLPDKLERGLHALRDAGDAPALYGSRTIITDEHLRQTGMSPLFTRATGFANAIVQNIAGGNTMLMTTAARRLMCLAPAHIDPVTHDWWAYQIVSAAGGTVVYDPAPTLLYRQHRKNLIGSNMGLGAQLRRFRAAVLKNQFSEWNTRNIAALAACERLILQQNRQLIDDFCAIRSHRGWQAVKRLKAAGIYRQTTAGDRSLRAVAYLGKM